MNQSKGRVIGENDIKKSLNEFIERDLMKIIKCIFKELKEKDKTFSEILVGKVKKRKIEITDILESFHRYSISVTKDDL